MEAVTGILGATLDLSLEMAPWLLFGVLAAGALHALLPLGWVARQLGGRGWAPVLKAAIFGVPLPLCSCSVVPVASSLRQQGASRAAVAAFLVSTPTSGPDSILATYALLGAPFAALRTALSFGLGLLAGGAARWLGRGQPDDPPAAAAPSPPPLASAADPCGGTCCASATAPAAAVGCGCDGGCGDVAAAAPRSGAGWGSKASGALRHAFGEVMGSVAGPLALGLLLGGLLSWWLPPAALEGRLAGGVLAYGAMLLVGIPLYVCASGSIPVAAALVAKGLSPGAALVFLLVGPATNAASLAVVGKLLGRRASLAYLAALAGGAVVAGLLTDGLFAAFPWSLATLPGAASEGATGAWYWVELGSLVCLAPAMLYHLVLPRLRGLRRPAKGDAPSPCGGDTCCCGGGSAK